MNKETFRPQLEKLKSMRDVVKAAGTKETTALWRFLGERLINPDSYVVFLGETSSGKSSIINGIIGKTVLPVSARPSTGTISEIVFTNDVTTPTYHKLTKDARLDPLTEAEFKDLTWRPTKDVARLRVEIPAKGFEPGLRLFDTPGYNSIVESHEEILRDFLPNSDAVVYTVGYRIGIQNEDFTFLRFLRELIGEKVPVIIAINRCPAGIGNNNPRIKEITKYAKDILGKTPEVFVVPQVAATDEEPALPKNDDMWRFIIGSLNADARKHQLAETFDGFIDDLFDKCNSIIKNRLAKAKMSAQEIAQLKATQKQYADRLRLAVPELIKPAFSRVVAKIPQKVAETARQTREKIFDDIDKAGMLDMEEEVGFINSHLMPFTIQMVGKDVINRYIEVEMNDLNKKVDDYIQKETIDFNNKVAIQINTFTDVAVSNLLSKGMAKLGSNGLASYVVQFGGAGGANAGLANAASHLLKKTGDFFGKTFSRATHNNLKHMMAKIGATSMKKVAGAIAVVAELLSFAYEVSVWKGKARNNVDKGLEKWMKETTPAVIEDLRKLEQTNIETVAGIADQWEHALDDEMPTGSYDMASLQADSNLADAWEAKYKH